MYSFPILCITYNFLRPFLDCKKPDINQLVLNEIIE